ncbi:hypothetical protein HKBW3S42_00068 [Candidatus Hakubella thermalkaliphila]|uniref:Uncharacterized protein n=1 Tax=Candidatus Hakubella thermalkaliphila TaxID=2754717 RepID=A0A6V8PLP5_9ACTN|nr:hypothetical protein HKBW3S42_00068 [Candidatus Hakubella thermalkaliphila]GFP43171.1 hypothetical protein HKBW3C_02301 [Candidatus Hakubella thermalkaliphila]
MRQLLVECSDPGLVITLAEEFENVLRQIDFPRAQALHGQLSNLARELGPECEEVWRGFRLEMPNDGGYPPAFGKRAAASRTSGVEEEHLKQLLAQAAERGLGQFELRKTVLLPQDGPAPETREQYVRDLADSIRWATWEELGIFQSPVELPEAMAAHRHQLIDEYTGDVLRARACFPAVGHLWIRDSLKQLEQALEEVNTRAEAVMSYELARLDPAEVGPTERIHWAALAARLGKEVEKWCLAAEESLAYIYQRAALVWLLWTECRGWGPARPFLEKCLQTLIEEAKTIYTADGLAALRLLYDDLRRPPWGELDSLLAEERAEAEDENTTVGD